MTICGVDFSHIYVILLEGDRGSEK